jgi:hypothetical protein
MPVMAARKRRPAGYYEVAGIDLAEEMQGLCGLPVFGGPDGPLACEVPRLDVRRPSKRPRRNLGFAVPGERRISVTAYPGIRPGDALEVLLHELVHIAIGRQGHSWHGRTFRSTLRRAMREAYGVAISPSAASIHGAYADELERRPLARSRIHPRQLCLDIAA